MINLRDYLIIKNKSYNRWKSREEFINAFPQNIL